MAVPAGQSAQIKRPANLRSATGLVLCGAGTAVMATALALIPAGPLTRHMLAHILVMNIVAPCVALVLDGRMRWFRLAAALWPVTVLQLALLWFWHTPAAMAAMHAAPLLRGLALVSLGAAALWFWIAILEQRGQHRWRAILALLLTGKLFCLLAALMVFAPRVLYPAMAHYQTAGPLDDQHLAGLIMLTACPLTYVLAGVVSATLWLNELAGRRSW